MERDVKAGGKGNRERPETESRGEEGSIHPGNQHLRYSSLPFDSISRSVFISDFPRNIPSLIQGKFRLIHCGIFLLQQPRYWLSKSFHA